MIKNGVKGIKPEDRFDKYAVALTKENDRKMNVCNDEINKGDLLCFMTTDDEDFAKRTAKSFSELSGNEYVVVKIN